MRPSAAALIVTAIAVAVGSVVALTAPGSGPGSNVVAQNEMTSMGVMHAATSQQASPGVAPATVKLLVKADDEHAKKGPEGTWHDAYLPANFTVKAGQQVTVHVYNYDEGKHSFTSPMIGVNATIAAGTEKKPTETTFTFVAPTEAGEYEWFCDFPCDPWAMEHKGFMRGEVTVS